MEGKCHNFPALWRLLEYWKEQRRKLLQLVMEEGGPTPTTLKRAVVAAEAMATAPAAAAATHSFLLDYISFALQRPLFRWDLGVVSSHFLGGHRIATFATCHLRKRQVVTKIERRTPGFVFSLSIFPEKADQVFFFFLFFSDVVSYFFLLGSELAKSSLLYWSFDVNTVSW